MAFAHARATASPASRRFGSIGSMSWTWQSPSRCYGTWRRWVAYKAMALNENFCEMTLVGVSR